MNGSFSPVRPTQKSPSPSVRTRTNAPKRTTPVMAWMAREEVRAPQKRASDDVFLRVTRKKRDFRRKNR